MIPTVIRIQTHYYFSPSSKSELFLVSIGQITINRRAYPDWTVKFEKLEKDELKMLGAPYASMRRGALRAAYMQCCILTQKYIYHNLNYLLPSKVRQILLGSKSWLG